MTAEELDIPKKSGVKKAVPTRSQRNDDKGDIFADSENEDEKPTNDMGPPNSLEIRGRVYHQVHLS